MFWTVLHSFTTAEPTHRDKAAMNGAQCLFVAGRGHGFSFDSSIVREWGKMIGKWGGQKIVRGMSGLQDCAQSWDLT